MGRPELFDARASRTRVLLEVEDVNDSPPRCTLATEVVRVAEGAPIGTQLDTRLEITDDDWVRIKYRIRSSHCISTEPISCCFN